MTAPPPAAPATTSAASPCSGSTLPAEAASQGVSTPAAAQDVVGYRSAAYASGLGRAIPLGRSGGHAVAQPVPGEGYDLAAPYPLLVLHDWHGLPVDLDAVIDAGQRPLSCVAVTDPFAELDDSVLNAAFPDHLRRWKDHHVADLHISRSDLVDRRHQRNVLRASVDVERCELAEHLPEWQRLYDHLIERHHITGPQAFSPRAFTAMAATPGMAAWRAVANRRTVGMILVVVDGDRAWYHLGAFDDLGYQRGASFALFWQILDDLAAAGVRWLDFGAGAGAGADGDDGLDRFKRGWASETRPTWLGGAILDADGYDAAVARTGTADADWFPKYRAGQYA